MTSKPCHVGIHEDCDLAACECLCHVELAPARTDQEVHAAGLRQVRRLMRREEGPAAYLAGQSRYRPLPITF